MVQTDHSTPLTSADSLLWRIERDPILRSPVVVLGLLDQAPGVPAVHRMLERACEVFPRLTDRIVPAAAPRHRPRWERDPGFDLAFHLRHVRITEPGDLAAVLELADPMVAEAFDPARPPWQLLLVDGLTGGGAAFVLRFHHAITDGVGGIGLAAELFDQERSPVAALPNRVPEPGGDWVADAASFVTRALRRTTGTAIATARDPLGAARQTAAMAASVGRLLAPVSKPCSPLLLGRSLGRHLDAFELDLPDLRAAAGAVDATVNDLLLAAVTGGLAHYHAAKDAPLTHLRVTMPVNLRSPGDAKGGNQFAPTRFEVPADVADAAKRVHALGAIARAARNEPALARTDVLASALDALPPAVVSRVFGDMLKHVDVDVSNVPGLRHDAFLGGARIEKLWAFAPPTGAALSVTLLSHLDRACIAVSADSAAVDDPDLLRRGLRAGFDEVLALAPPAAAARTTTKGRSR
jgi:diacylglycerol O-acyltransferase